MANLEDARRGSEKELVDTPLKKEHRLERFLAAAIAIFVLAVWEWRARAGAISLLFFPAPSTIIATLFNLLANGELVTNTGATLSRLLRGFVLGGAPGLVLGLAMGWSRRLRAIIDPFIAAFHPVPKIAILPLIMIIFGIGETSKVVIIAVTTFFPMLINTMAGVRQISPTYFEVAENYGANLYQLFTRVVFPGSLPLILTGARLSLNIALLLTIAVELVSSRDGLGDMIWFAWETLRTEELYACLVVIAVLGIAFNLLLQFLTGRLAPWHVERQTS
ncbi:MAG: ABC transporter permease [Anaerolineales bacterium]|nr:ABC transporter permease [Anaerolineales bacterium]